MFCSSIELWDVIMLYSRHLLDLRRSSIWWLFRFSFFKRTLLCCLLPQGQLKMTYVRITSEVLSGIVLDFNRQNRFMYPLCECLYVSRSLSSSKSKTKLNCKSPLLLLSLAYRCACHIFKFTIHSQSRCMLWVYIYCTTLYFM